MIDKDDFQLLIPEYKKFHRRVDADIRIEEVLKATRIIAEVPGLSDWHRKKFLKELVWNYTAAEGGKYNLRYSTEGALLCESGREIQHEHVIPIMNIVNEIIANPTQACKIISNSLACLVTKDEHRKLTKITKINDETGWNRYKVAGITVRHFINGKWELLWLTSS